MNHTIIHTICKYVLCVEWCMLRSDMFRLQDAVSRRENTRPMLPVPLPGTSEFPGLRNGGFVLGFLGIVNCRNVAMTCNDHVWHVLFGWLDLSWISDSGGSKDSIMPPIWDAFARAANVEEGWTHIGVWWQWCLVGWDLCNALKARTEVLSVWVRAFTLWKSVAAKRLHTFNPECQVGWHWLDMVCWNTVVERVYSIGLLTSRWIGGLWKFVTSGHFNQSHACWGGVCIRFLPCN